MTLAGNNPRSTRPPRLPLPEPLRAVENPSFTHYSVVVRLPDIARRTISENNFPPEINARIHALIDEIPGGQVRQVDLPLAPDARDWHQYVAPYQGMNWLEIPWFFAEEYFYVRMLEATRYYHPGSWQGVDPYLAQKRLGLVSTRDHIHTLAGQIDYALHLPPASRRDALTRLILANLWGNQNDLSLWPVEKDSGNGGWSGGSSAASVRKNAQAADGARPSELDAARQHVLADDSATAVDWFLSQHNRSLEVMFLVDNAGYELATDLALAMYLLEENIAGKCILQVKSQPVFVSDATVQDVHDTLDTLLLDGDAPTKHMAIRLRQCLVDGCLALRAHPFWTSPLALWEMPDDLRDEVNQTGLLISKGDANYRRLLGDRHWPLDLPFTTVVDYLQPAVLSLRTLKSELAIGLDARRIPMHDPEWMTNGRWGLVQFAPPAKTDSQAT